MSRRGGAVWRFGLAVLFAHGLGAAQAAERGSPASTVTLKELLRGLDGSPVLRAESALEGLASAEVRAAAVHPNPTLGYVGGFHVHGRDTIDGSWHQVTVEQPLLLGGQRAARISAARSHTAAARAATHARRHELAAAVRARFVEALGARERVKVLESGVADLERVTEIVRGRRDAGERSEYDVVRIETALASAKTNVIEADADEAAAVADVMALLGKSPVGVRLEGDLRPRRIDGRGAPSHPSARAARMAVDASVATLGAARREGAIVPSVIGGVQSTTHAYGSAVIVGLSLPLPLFDRAQGPIARASAEQKVAAARHAAVLAELAVDRERARSLYAQRVAALNSFERTALPRIERMRGMAEDAYRDGQTTVTELLDALTTIRELRLEHLERILAAKRAEIEVLRASGMALTP